MNPPTVRKSCLHEKEFWFLILSGILLFYRPLFGGETFFYRDLYLHFYPQKLRFLELIVAGEVPLWDSYLHGGQPFLGNLNNAVLYPSNLLYLVLPATLAFNVDIVLQILLCAAGAYWLARKLGLGPIPSMVAGGIYGFCGYTLSLANIYHRLAAHPYIPLVLACWHLYLTGGKRRWFLLAVLFGVVQFMGGAPETSALTFALVLGWSIAYPYEQPPVRRIVFWLLLVLLVVGISAVQILPTMDMVQHSMRSKGGNFYSFTGWSLHLKRLPELVLPGFFGDPYGVLQSNYWGWHIEDLGYPFLISIYFGILPILFAVQGTLTRSGESILPHRIRYFLWLVFLVSLVLSMGRNLPLYQWIYDYGGVLTWFRYPIKILTIGLLPLGLLAGAGLASLLEGERKPNRTLPLMLAVMAFSSLIVIILFQKEGFADRILMSYFQQTGESVRKGLLDSFAHTTVFCLIGFLLLLYRRLRVRSWQYWILAAWVVCGLLQAGRLVNQYAPRSLFDMEPNLVSQVKEEIGQGRLFRDTTPDGIVFHLPGNDSAYLARWRLELLDFYTASLYSIPVIFHEDLDKLAPEKISWLAEKMRKMSWEKRSPLLSAAGVTLILTADRTSEFQLLKTIRNSSNTPFYLYRNTRALPPVSFVGNWKTVRTREEAFDDLTDPDFDPATTVLIGEERSSERACESSARIERLESRTTVTQHRIITKCDGYLVFTESNYPGWRVRVNGRSVPLVDANLGFSAVFLTAGEHFVERKYVPRSVYAGLAISLLSLILTFFLAPHSRKL